MFEARDLKKSFGALEVTRGVSFCIPRGGRYGIVGPNGSGKTTLLNLLSGNLRPDTGRVLLGGQDVTTLSPDRRARAGLARSFQKNNLFPDLTARENLSIAVAIGQRRTRIFWRSVHGLDDMAATVETIAKDLRLSDVLDVQSRVLPYGTQRQLELGLALAVRPQVLMLDEPTAGMSPEETAAMAALIAELPSEITLLIIEHDMDVLFQIADRVMVLDYGTILMEGTPSEVRASDVVKQRYFGQRHDG